MKKMVFCFACVALSLSLLTGCGGTVNESKPVAQVTAEAAKMGSFELQTTIEIYEMAVTEKTKRFDVVRAGMKEIPMDKIMSDESVALNKEAAALAASLNILKEHLAVYRAALQKK